MSGESLPPEVRQFIARHIASVEELEILLLLLAGEARPCTAESAYQVIKSSRQSVEHGLRKFIAAGFAAVTAETPPGFTFRSNDSEPVIRELGRCYRQMPVRVVEAIYQKPRDSAQDFADAFKLKRDP